MSSRNATASWSGYLHQGKVGLFLLLNKLREQICNQEDYNGWYIEYESAEDIDIKKSENHVHSRHQVKAYKDGTTPNKYKEVLGVLTYSHKEGKVTMETPGFQICPFDEKGNPLAVDVGDDSRFLHTIVEVRGFGMDQKELIAEYGGKTLISPVPNPNNIKLYEYPDGNFYCKLSNGKEEKKDVLAEFCIEEIKQILRAQQGASIQTENQYKKIYYYLLYVLDTEIRVKHVNSGYPVLFFNKILDVITQSEIEESHISTVRAYFVKEWDEFLEERVHLGKALSLKKEEQFDKLIRDIYNLEDEKLLQFFKDINPDVHIEGSTVTKLEMIDLCRSESLRDVFFECLVRIEELEFDQEFVGYKQYGGFLLTLINRAPGKVNSVIQSIISNRKATQSLFSRKYLVNSQIDGIRISERIDQIPQVAISTNWNKEVTTDDRFINPNITFISAENAIDKLNNGDDKE